MTNKREYLVYVSGRANETRTYVWAERKADALFRIARHYGVKSTECDGSMVLKRQRRIPAERLGPRLPEATP
jgi:hypothetical protein